MGGWGGRRRYRGLIVPTDHNVLHTLPSAWTSGDSVRYGPAMCLPIFHTIGYTATVAVGELTGASSDDHDDVEASS